jgi:hypothetical protein
MAHTETINREICKTMLKQIGAGNVMAICGGRYERSGPLSVRMQVGQGYYVEVTYVEGHDWYRVERQYKRNGTFHVKGAVEPVYCDQLGDIAYRASCFHNGPFPGGQRVDSPEDDGVIEEADGTMVFV